MSKSRGPQLTLPMRARHRTHGGPAPHTGSRLSGSLPCLQGRAGCSQAVPSHTGPHGPELSTRKLPPNCRAQPSTQGRWGRWWAAVCRDQPERHTVKGRLARGLHRRRSRTPTHRESPSEEATAKHGAWRPPDLLWVQLFWGPDKPGTCSRGQAGGTLSALGEGLAFPSTQAPRGQRRPPPASPTAQITSRTSMLTASRNMLMGTQNIEPRVWAPGGHWPCHVGVVTRWEAEAPRRARTHTCAPPNSWRAPTGWASQCCRHTVWTPRPQATHTKHPARAT